MLLITACEKNAIGPALPQPATYFVNGKDPHTNDANDGRAATRDPAGRHGLKTLSQALSLLPPGDSLRVRACTYEESRLRLTRSGTADAPITVATDPPGAAVVVDGGRSRAADGFVIGRGQGYLSLTGFELRNMRGAGVATLDSSHHEGPVLRDLAARRCEAGFRTLRAESFTISNVRVENKHKKACSCAIAPTARF